MANDLGQTGLRQTLRRDLHRLTTPFAVDGKKIESGAAIALARSAEGMLPYLDGDVFSTRVTLAPSVGDPYTGTRWVLRRDEDGTWGFLNQGQPENMLVATAGSVTLARPLAAAGMARFVTSRWLLYRDLIGFRLRPVMPVSGWLGVRDGKLVLSDRNDTLGRWIYWDIIPLENGPVPPRR
jgi:hypothetical protein